MDSDILLLNAAKKMDEEALARIFDLYASPLYRYVLRLCDDPLKADEIVGAVFAKFLEQLSSKEGPAANLRVHLYELTHLMIVGDLHYDPWRKAVETNLSAFLGNSPAPAAGVNGELLSAALRVIKFDLTEDQRSVLYLRFLEGFTLKETAAIIGKKVGNVKVIQNRAAAALRKSLERQGFEIGDPPMDMADFLSSNLSGSRPGYTSRLILT